MLSATVQNVDRIPSNDERGSGRISSTPTCSQCFDFLDGICKLKASADWGDDSKVSPKRNACVFARILPF